MAIRPSGSQPSARGPEQHSTGTVPIDPLIEAPEPARVRAAMVTFEPAMRTALGIVRPGGAIGRVGVPHYEAIPNATRPWMSARR